MSSVLYTLYLNHSIQKLQPDLGLSVKSTGSDDTFDDTYNHISYNHIYHIVYLIKSYTKEIKRKRK